MKRMISLVAGLVLLTSPAHGTAPCRVAIVKGIRRYDIGTPSDRELEFVRALAKERVDRDGPLAQTCSELVSRLVSFGLLVEVYQLDGRDRFSRNPMRAPHQHGPVPGTVQLSRFAKTTRSGDRVILSAGTGTSTFDLYDLSLLAEIFTDAVPTTGDGQVATLARLLFESGVAVDDDMEGSSALWSAHELDFHVKSRRHRAAILGENFGSAPTRVIARAERYPALGRPIKLPTILDRSGADQMSLSSAIRSRRSTRRYDEEHPITIEQLATLLRAMSGGSDEVPPGTTPRRPYPSGGALYELDLYVAVRTCVGVPPDTYLYDGETHTLRPVSAPIATPLLIADTARAMAGEHLPQVLIVVAARFGTLMSKYREMGYSLILKHVGVVMELGYLVAAAEQVGLCALGSGDPELFAAVTRLDPLAVSSVGEISVGSLPADQEATP